MLFNDVANNERIRADIFHDDAICFLKSLSDESIDMIITDPAYNGMNKHLMLGNGRIVGEYSKRGNGGRWFEEFEDTQENYDCFLAECYRVLKKDRHIFIMFDSFSLLSLGQRMRQHFDVKNIIAWNKVNIGMGHYFRRQCEFIIFASKGKRPLTRRDIPDVWHIKRVHKAVYPTQKPVELFHGMIASSIEMNHDFLVCDPFVGSGSAAIAALRHGCSFIGCDRSEEAVSLTKDRISHFLRTKMDCMQPCSQIAINMKTWW